ncbi:hypothetical protein N7489_006514, partial [Penicillium chrysogenum]|uniref:uncharacterized protein n=1 Tax=Penicillium chrysogenum TaxID=5076 RepID=UPI0024DF28F4
MYPRSHLVWAAHAKSLKTCRSGYQRWRPPCNHLASIVKRPSLGAAITEEPKKSLLSITWSQKSFIYGFKDHYMEYNVRGSQLGV